MSDVSATELLTLRELAERHDVSINTTRNWCKRGLRELASDKRGKRNALLFDNSRVKKWLTAQGIVPGAHGRSGGLATAGQESSRSSGTIADGEGGSGATPTGPDRPAVDPTAGAVFEGFADQAGSDAQTMEALLEECGDMLQAMGLEGAVFRLGYAERVLGLRVIQGLMGGAESLEALSGLKNWGEACENLRKVSKALADEMERVGELVPVTEYRAQMSELAGELAKGLETFPTAVMDDLVDVLEDQGVEVADPNAFHRAMYPAIEKIVDAWRSRLAETLRRRADDDE